MNIYLQTAAKNRDTDSCESISPCYNKNPFQNDRFGSVPVRNGSWCGFQLFEPQHHIHVQSARSVNGGSGRCTTHWKTANCHVKSDESSLFGRHRAGGWKVGSARSPQRSAENVNKLILSYEPLKTEMFQCNKHDAQHCNRNRTKNVPKNVSGIGPVREKCWCHTWETAQELSIFWGLMPKWMSKGVLQLDQLEMHTMKCWWSTVLSSYWTGSKSTNEQLG